MQSRVEAPKTARRIAAEAAAARREWMASPERQALLAKPNEVHLAQALLRKYWERTKSDPENKCIESIDLIRFGEDVPPEIVFEIKEICRSHRRVFESANDGRPLAVRGAETRIKLKEGARPKRYPEPRWGHGPLRDILTA